MVMSILQRYLEACSIDSEMVSLSNRPNLIRGAIHRKVRDVQIKVTQERADLSVEGHVVKVLVWFIRRQKGTLNQPRPLS